MGNIYKLSQCQRDLIAMCGLSAGLTLKEFADHTGYSEHQLRYALQDLHEKRAALSRWVIDVYRLGWQRYSFYCSLQAKSPRSKEQFLQKIKDSPAVYYATETVGDFEYELTLLARSPAEARAILAALSSSNDCQFFRKALAVRTYIVIFPRKYLSSRTPLKTRLEHGETSVRLVPDDLDLAIIRQLNRVPDFSMPELSRQVMKPRSTVERHVHELQEKQVLVGKVLWNRPDIYGHKAHKLLLSWRGFNQRVEKQLLNWAMQQPNCSYCHTLFGDWDYEIGVEVEEASQLSVLRNELSATFSEHLLDMRILSRGNTIKYHYYQLEGDVGDYGRQAGGSP